MIPLKTTYLEMLGSPHGLAHGLAHGLGSLPSNAEIRRLNAPSVAFFRFLYNTIGDGRNGYWWVRREITDEELWVVLNRPASEIHVLYASGEPAGFYELDLTNPGNIEIAFFGILPAFQGQGFGRALLAHAIADAWHHNPGRLWLHTCNYDSPGALKAYLSAGFVVYAEETGWIALPKADNSVLGSAAGFEKIGGGDQFVDNPRLA